MATEYGTNTSFETIRDLIVAELNALKTNMVTNSIVPAISAVYANHWADPALTFNAVSVGLTTSEHSTIAQSADPVGPAISDEVNVEIRVMIGYRKIYMDELMIGRLMNSIMNWLQEQRKLDTNYRIWETMRTENGIRFEDTDTIGGQVTVLVRGQGAYTTA
jgi:hypothetical protein